MLASGKQFFGGVFCSEVAAALALDRISLKLFGLKAALQLPPELFSSLEIKFISHQSREFILAIIGNGTYEAEFTKFLKHVCKLELEEYVDEIKHFEYRHTKTEMKSMKNDGSYEVRFVEFFKNKVGSFEYAILVGPAASISFSSDPQNITHFQVNSSTIKDKGIRQLSNKMWEEVAIAHDRAVKKLFNNHTPLNLPQRLSQIELKFLECHSGYDIVKLLQSRTFDSQLEKFLYATMGPFEPSNKHKGVWRTRLGEWLGRIEIRDQNRFLGIFPSEEDAALAYKRVEYKLFCVDEPFKLARGMYSSIEQKFIAGQSEHNLLVIIKALTYESRFTEFLRAVWKCSSSYFADDKLFFWQIYVESPQLLTIEESVEYHFVEFYKNKSCQLP